MAEKFDFSDAPDTTPQDSDQFSELRRRVRAQGVAMMQMSNAKEALEVASTTFAEYRDKLVPEQAASMGWKGGVIEVDGLTYDVDIKSDVVGKLPEDPEKRAAAIAYLDELQEGDSVKRVLIISLGRDAAALEKRIVEGVQRVAPNAEISSKVDVHPATLCKIGKEYLAKGKKIDLTKLGLIALKRSRIALEK